MTGPAAPVMGVVVVNFGSHELVAQNLGEIEVSSPWARLVIVDNFRSAADSAAMSRLAGERGWELVTLPTNIGFGAAVNLGVARAELLGCTSFLSLNPDATVKPAVLAALRDECEASRDALISPAVVRPDGTPWFRIGRIAVESGGLGRMPAGGDDREGWLSGACLAAHRDVWTSLRGYDDDYFLYWEDVDLSRRCVETGGRLIVRDDLQAVHDVGGTQGSGKSGVYYYYNCRNRLLFAAKHLSGPDQLRWIGATPHDLRKVLNRGGRREYLKVRRSLAPAMAGVVAGLVWLVRSDMTRLVRRLMLGRPARPAVTPRRPGATTGEAAPWQEGSTMTNPAVCTIERGAR